MPFNGIEDLRVGRTGLRPFQLVIARWGSDLRTLPKRLHIADVATVGDAVGKSCGVLTATNAGRIHFLI